MTGKKDSTHARTRKGKGENPSYPVITRHAVVAADKPHAFTLWAIHALQTTQPITEQGEGRGC